MVLDQPLAKATINMNSQRRNWTVWELANSEKYYARKLLPVVGQQLSFKDETSKIAVEYILARVSVGDIIEEVILETVGR